MARYEHLPIYQKSMELAVYLQNVVRNFSRYDKYSIGEDLRDLSRRILLLIIRANNTRNKEAVLRDLVECCEMLKTMLIFAKEVKAFASFKSFQHAANLAVMVSKQSGGWLKSSMSGPNSKSSDR